MKYVFTAKDDAFYGREHRTFVEYVLESGGYKGLEGILYKGSIPPNCEVFKLSAYLDLMGCAEVPGGYCGYNGFKTHEEIIKEFLIHALDFYEDSNYTLEIDVMQNAHNDKNLSSYVDTLSFNE